MTELIKDIDHLVEANEFCRKRNIGFILSNLFGPSGFAFVDYGTDFTITDADGEETKAFIVTNVT